MKKRKDVERRERKVLCDCTILNCVFQESNIGYIYTFNDWPIEAIDKARIKTSIILDMPWCRAQERTMTKV